MTSFKIVLAYDGTQFVGWQRQAAGTSIQGLLEDALRALDQRDVAVIGAGRTDAGVHALGQVAGFSLERAIAPDALIRAVNGRLPDAVRVVSAVEVSPAFHARFGARSKTYCYRIWNGDVMSPFERAYAWHVPGSIAVGRDREGAARGESPRPFGRRITSNQIQTGPGQPTTKAPPNGSARRRFRCQRVRDCRQV